MSHPPRPVNGRLITWPLTNTLRFSYPENLLSELLPEVGPYLSDLATMYRGEKNYIKKAKKYIRRRTDAMLYIMKNYPADFNMVVYTEVDRVSHFAYAGFGEELKQAYIAIDEALGQILNQLPEDMVLAVVSDHGFTDGKWDFHIHDFLREQGWLDYKPGVDDESWALNKLDWNRTICYMPAPGCYGLNFNLKGRQKYGIVERDEYHHLFEQVKEQLLFLKTPDGLPLFKEVLTSSEVYPGPYSCNAPDLIMIPYDYGNMIQMSSSPIEGEYFVKGSQAGYHRREGIFILKSPVVKPGKYESLRLIDVLPNLFYASSWDLPHHFDGKVIFELFHESWNAQHSIRKVGQSDYSFYGSSSTDYTEEEKKLIEKRLRDLGYL
jgi:predicted AlkP superfamily phosphohydrolase/phosphomutase